jgi:hypothetical protein
LTWVAAPERFDQGGIAFVPIGRKRLLEILHEPATVLDVLLGTADDLVQAESGERQFLGSANPAFRRRGEHPQKLRQARFVWGTHVH